MVRYESKNGHHQLWVQDGHGMPLDPAIEEWLRWEAGSRWIAACGMIATNHKPGTFYNFADHRIAQLFKLRWYND